MLDARQPCREHAMWKRKTVPALHVGMLTSPHACTTRAGGASFALCTCCFSIFCRVLPRWKRQVRILNRKSPKMRGAASCRGPNMSQWLRTLRKGPCLGRNCMREIGWPKLPCGRSGVTADCTLLRCHAVHLRTCTKAASIFQACDFFPAYSLAAAIATRPATVV